MTIRKLISGGCVLQANMDVVVVAIESVARAAPWMPGRRLMFESDVSLQDWLTRCSGPPVRVTLRYVTRASFTLLTLTPFVHGRL